MLRPYASGMGDLDARQLRTLAAVADVGTFGRAAELLGYSQSTVSQHIGTLERALGGAVFDRPGGPRPVRLTPLGDLVLDRGRQLLTGFDDLAEAVERFRSGGGRVDIGSFHSVSAVILPPLVHRLRQERPDCEIRLFEGEPEDPRMGDLDLLFHDAPVPGQVESVKLWDDAYVVVTRRGELGDPSAEVPVPVHRLSGSPLLMWPDVCDQPRLEAALRAHGCNPRVVFRSASSETLVAMVRSGLGSAILPRLAVDALAADRQLQVQGLHPGLSREIYLHWPSDRTRSPLAVRAVEVAVEVARQGGGEPGREP